MSNKPNTKAGEFSITDTCIDLTPVAAVFNITNKTIENFVFNYLTRQKKIDKFEAVRVLTEKTSNYGNIITIYGFISQQSADITANTMRFNSIISDRIDNTSFKTSPNLQSALSKVASNTRLICPNTRDRRAPLGVKLDTFKVLSLMLAVDPYRHELQITEVKVVDGGVVCTVIKKEKLDNRSKNESGDKYTNLIKSFR